MQDSFHSNSSTETFANPNDNEHIHVNVHMWMLTPFSLTPIQNSTKGRALYTTVIRRPSMSGLESMGHWKSRSFRTHKETNKRRCRGGSSWGTSHPITLLCASTVSLLHNPTSSGQNVLHNIQCRELHNIQCANYWATSNAQNMMQHPMYKLLDNIQCTEARLKHCPRVGSYAYALAGEPAFRRITCYVTKAGSQWCPLYRGSTIPWQTPVYNSHQGWIPMVAFI
jgi:hypothetical protein